jgi:polyhydroxyalkanoate synthesis regulator phasin
MAELPDWRQMFASTMSVTEVGRDQARRIVDGLVERGQVARDQAQSAVDDVIAMSRERSEALAELIRAEVQRQVRTLGIATRDDLDALEQRLARPAPVKKAPVKKAVVKKAVVKKAPAKKAAG